MDGLWVDGARAPTKLIAVRLSARRLCEYSSDWCLVSQAIDTGTSLIYVPPAVADAFYSLIRGSKRANQYGPGKPPHALW